MYMKAYILAATLLSEDMMRRSRRYRGIACALTLAGCTVAASAAAEGPWVLWGDVTGPPMYEMMRVLVSTFDTKQACEHALRKRVAQTRRVKAKNTEVIVDDARGMLRVSERTRMTDGSIWVTTTRYVCLPDTVDPRGPKGK
jgi:hypothetical protein